MLSPEVAFSEEAVEAVEAKILEALPGLFADHGADEEIAVEVRALVRRIAVKTVALAVEILSESGRVVSWDDQEIFPAEVRFDDRLMRVAWPEMAAIAELTVAKKEEG